MNGLSAPPSNASNASNVQIGPDAATAEWTVAGHVISAGFLPGTRPRTTDVWVTYDGMQLPKMTIEAPYDTTRRGIEALKARVLQAMALPLTQMGVEPPGSRFTPSVWREAGPRRDLALGTSGVTAIVLLVSGVPVVVAMAGAGVAGWAMGKALGRIRG